MMSEIRKGFDAALGPTERPTEIDLFRALAGALTQRGSLASFEPRSTAIEETHGRKGWVSFESEITGKTARIEIADLLIVNLCKQHINACLEEVIETRICFMQAKRSVKNIVIPSEKNCALQWELLHRRCDVDDAKKRFPRNILNFTEYKTITSYGVFYKDSGIWELLFSIPENFHAHALPLRRNSTIQFCRPLFEGHTEQGYKANNAILESPVPVETVYTDSLNAFEHELCRGTIGAPIPAARNEITASILDILFSIDIATTNQTSKTLAYEIARNLGGDVSDGKHENIAYPDMLLIVTGGCDDAK
jgi:hypothetical protein